MVTQAVHSANIYNLKDSPYTSNPSIIERKVEDEKYSTQYSEAIYELLKDKTSLNHKKSYPTAMMQVDIIDKIHQTFGYSIKEMHESSLTDEEGTFAVYTVLLDLEERDYSKLLEEEWEVSESLGLYEKNIILRFV